MRSRFGFLAITALVVMGGCDPSLQGTEGFERRPIDIAHYGLHDLGVTDVNGDSLLDVFTSNHSGRQSLLLNRGQAGFQDMFSALALDQDKSFPGLAVAPSEPPIDKPGLYINWSGPLLVVRAHDWRGKGAISGTVELLSPVKIGEKLNFDVIAEEQSLASGATRTKIKFNGKGDGHFLFTPFHHALPITFRVDSGPPAERIYVGPDRRSPSSAQFAIAMRDRHGMAWADFDADGRSDVFITRGGNKGWQARIPEKFWDELLLAGPEGYRDVGRAAGLVKEGCSGYQAAWVDYDGDNLLDLYVACGRSLHYQPNKLYRQVSNKRFIEVAARVGLDIGLLGSFVWLDADNDGDMDLLYVDRYAFYLYKNKSGQFTAGRLGSTPAQWEDTRKLTVADFDADGDLDVFAASPGGNALLVNVGGTFAVTDPVQWGLPQESLTANWIDFDNDGRPDLHAVPDGLFRQTKSGRFERISLLGIATSRFSEVQLADARTSWFDMDNDGARDLIVALNYSIKGGRLARWVARLRGTNDRLGGLDHFSDVMLLRNTRSAKHWLQVELVGPPGNRPGIGARVEVITPDAHQLQQVGAAEGSHFSLGHYRLYFGLGRHANPERLRVFWPDGRTQEIRNPEGNRLLTVDWRGSGPV